MTSITYIGMDVHTTNFTLCCYSFEDDRVYATVQVKPEYTQIIKNINRIRKQHGEDTRFVCGYEAGCLGYDDKQYFSNESMSFVSLTAGYHLHEYASRMLRIAFRDFVLDGSPGIPNSQQRNYGRCDLR